MMKMKIDMVIVQGLHVIPMHIISFDCGVSMSCTLKKNFCLMSDPVRE